MKNPSLNLNYKNSVLYYNLLEKGQVPSCGHFTYATNSEEKAPSVETPGQYLMDIAPGHNAQNRNFSDY